MPRPATRSTVQSQNICFCRQISVTTSPTLGDDLQDRLQVLVGYDGGSSPPERGTLVLRSLRAGDHRIIPSDGAAAIVDDAVHAMPGTRSAGDRAICLLIPGLVPLSFLLILGLVPLSFLLILGLAPCRDELG